MIDLDNLERTLELANDYVDDGLHFLTEPVSYGELKLLAERLISAEKDAARYRWLREEAASVLFSAPLVFNADDCANPESWIDGEHLDHAVDKAMQCNK